MTLLCHLYEVASVVKHFSARRVEKSHERLHQHGLSRAALTYYEVCLSVLEHRIDVFEDFLFTKGFVDVS